MNNFHNEVKEIIRQHQVVLFMKGTKFFPRCGFSARAVEILMACEVEFKDVDVLINPEFYQTIMDYVHWPMLPQLYIAGEFIGGSDLLPEMYQSGELQRLLKGENYHWSEKK